MRNIDTGQRFIPAGAGNTPEPETGRERWAVHPRWRGEHQLVVLATLNERGSSPLARGTRAVSAP